MTIILLGDGCSISWLAQTMGFKREDSPFEWFRGDHFKDINHVIKNINTIQIVPYKFPGNICYENTDIFSSHYTLNQFFDISKRRLNRFIDDIKNNNTITFLRRDYYNTGISLCEYNEFKSLIKDINSNCNFKIYLFRTKPHEEYDENIIVKQVEVNTAEEPKESKKNKEDIDMWDNILKEIYSN